MYVYSSEMCRLGEAGVGGSRSNRCPLGTLVQYRPQVAMVTLSGAVQAASGRVRYRRRTALDTGAQTD